MKGTDFFVKRLLDRISTTATLKAISDTLEELSQKKSFKQHANAIVEDETLTAGQKRTQILHLIKSVEVPLLFEFFSDELSDSTFWIFSNSRIDYFDKFVQEFQLATETIGIVHLTTAIALTSVELKKIQTDLSKSFGYKVIINYQLKPAIVGGAQVRVENLVFDYSLRSKFMQFQKEWLSQLEQTEKIVDSR